MLTIIIGIVVLVLIAAVGTYFWFHPLSGMERPSAKDAIGLVEATTTTWYVLEDNALHAVPVPIDAKTIDGPGRPLGILPDGSLLTFLPIGLVHITHDGTETQLLSAGPAGSSTPIAVASADLTIIAFQNQVTRAIDVYHLDPVKLEAVYAGTAKVPHADRGPVKLPDSFLSNLATTSEGQWTKASVKTFDEELTRQTARARFESESAAEPQAVAYKDGDLIIETVSGTFYSFSLSDGRIGEPTPLRVLAFAQ